MNSIRFVIIRYVMRLFEKAMYTFRKRYFESGGVESVLTSKSSLFPRGEEEAIRWMLSSCITGDLVISMTCTSFDDKTAKGMAYKGRIQMILPHSHTGVIKRESWVLMEFCDRDVDSTFFNNAFVSLYERKYETGKVSLGHNSLLLLGMKYTELETTVSLLDEYASLAHTLFLYSFGLTKDASKSTMVGRAIKEKDTFVGNPHTPLPISYIKPSQSSGDIRNKIISSIYNITKVDE